MLAVVKMPRTNCPCLEIRGAIPSWIIDRLRREFGKNVIVSAETDPENELLDIFSSSWYKKASKRVRPGDAIRVYRQNRGFSQSALGHLLGGLPRQNVCGMERGTRAVSKEMAKKLSAIFQVPVGRFIA